MPASPAPLAHVDLPATRFRFASGSGRASQPQGDLEEQLRKRLRFVATVFLSILGGLGAVIAIRDVVVAEGSQREVGLRLLFAMAAQSGLYAWAVWRLRPRASGSIAFLRRVELGGVASWMLGTFAVLYIDFPTIVPSLPSNPFSLGAYSAGVCALGIVAYGVIIPNTWRRCATIIGVMVVGAILPDIVNVLRFDVAARTAIPFLISKAAFVATFAALAGYGSYRIELSETAARAANQLGQYVLRERLGAGGMGEVYRAEHQYLRRPCAVKLIRAEQAGDADVLQRFEREVQATATLTHPNTVAIYDYGIADNGTFYYVMEFLPGVTLEQLVTEEGPLPPARAVHVMRQIVSALAEAHGIGLTHRDIKPGNVMLCERGGVPDVAKLLDFGLVVTSGSAIGDAKLTQAGMILGTPAYMSPEQCGGESQPGPASDIYSVGALAYFLLSGKSPFEGRGPVQMLMAHLGEAPASLASLRTDLSPEIESIVMRCLAKHPADRFASASALEAALARQLVITPWLA
jgi:serine/threonine-protein kinase